MIQTESCRQPIERGFKILVITSFVSTFPFMVLVTTKTSAVKMIYTIYLIAVCVVLNSRLQVKVFNETEST